MAAAAYPRKSTVTKFQFDGSENCVVLVCRDTFLRNHHTVEVIEKLESIHGDIDRFDFDGDNAPPGEVLEELQSVGLLHVHKLVIVDKADSFLVSKGGDDGDSPKPKGGSRARQILESYAKSPSDGATLLLRTETWRGGNLDKLMSVFRVGVEGESQATSWCLRRCEKEYGVAIEKQAADLLVNRVGLDLGRLDGELAKLAMLADSDKHISLRMVKEAVGASREEQGWAIKNAVVLDGPEGSLQTIREIFELSRDRQDVPAFWALTDLLRSLHSASSLLDNGTPRNQAQREAGIFDRKGDRRTADRIMTAAGKMPPAEAAARLRDAVHAQADLRRGIGDPRHALEGLTVQLADRLRELAPR